MIVASTRNFEKGGSVMPGGDGTGPRGFGPGTGRGAGFCWGYPKPGYANPTPGYRNWRGLGYPQPRRVIPNEKIYLEQQAEFLREQLRTLEARLNDIDGSDGQ